MRTCAIVYIEEVPPQQMYDWVKRVTKQQSNSNNNKIENKTKNNEDNNLNGLSIHSVYTSIQIHSAVKMRWYIFLLFLMHEALRFI